MTGTLSLTILTRPVGCDMAQEVSYFECGDCGGRARTTVVDYDTFGYPVCPECGARSAPV